MADRRSAVAGCQHVQQFFPHHTTTARKQMKAEIELQIETVNARIGEDGWMRIAPWGDYPAKASIKKPDGQVEQGTITQRITAETAADVVNDFRTLVGKAQRFFRSVPVYLGHPDFKASASQYPDKGMKGAVSEVEVRNDGLYAKPQFNDEGEALLETTNGLAPSAVFACQVREVAGQRIAFPVRLRSVGLTNRPNLPVETINSCGGPIGEEAKPTVTGEADGAKAGAQGADSSNQPAVAAQAVAANDSTDQSKAALALELGLEEVRPVNNRPAFRSIQSVRSVRNQGPSIPPDQIMISDHT